VNTAIVTATQSITGGNIQANTGLSSTTLSVSGQSSVGSLQANTSVNTATITATQNITTAQNIIGNNIQANTGLSSNTLSVSGTTRTGVLIANTSATVPTLTVSTKLDANAATESFFNNIQATGQVSVGGNFIINGATVYNTNTFVINAGSSTGQISNFSVNRGNSGANASIRWNETEDYFDILNVNNGIFNRILTDEYLSSSTTLASTSNVATSAAVAALQGVSNTQNTRIQSVETINANQNNSITIIQGVDATQNIRLNSIETVSINQNTAISIIQGVDVTQNTRLNSIETNNINQNNSITIIQGVDVTQNTRLNSIETVSVNQNTSIAIIQGVDVTQNTRITSTESSISIIQGVDVTQNTRLNAIETTNQNQNTSITVIQGVDTTQNTRLSAIETINNNQNTSITIIQGVNATQNTRLGSIETINDNQNTTITQVNQFAAAAFNKANTDFTTLTAAAGSYGGSTSIPVVNLTANGRVSSITTTSIIAGATITDDNDSDETRFVMMGIATSGNYLVANTSSAKLTFNPSSGTLTAVSFNALSDENKKTNIKIIDNALDIIDDLKGVTFDYKDSGKPSAGLIAQDVEKYLPQLISEDENGKTLNYNGVIGILVEAIKELKQEVDELKKK
jgi:hypothetical protein